MQKINTIDVYSDALSKINPQNIFTCIQEKKQEIFLPLLKEISKFHMDRCEQYRRFVLMNGVSGLINSGEPLNSYSQLPALPITAFKTHNLSSVGGNDLLIMTSSGTSGNGRSRIVLDRLNSNNQTKSLLDALKNYFGALRLPMIVLNENQESDGEIRASSAAYRGFGFYSKTLTYAFDKKNNFNAQEVEKFFAKNSNGVFIIFGFTAKVYEILIKSDLLKNFDLRSAIIIHGGGWKRLEYSRIDDSLFKKLLFEKYEVTQVRNYYGLVEQLGSIYMECEFGRLHAPHLGDICVVDKSGIECSIGQEGIIKLYSLLPTSYPGHVILTEDYGKIIGIDDCKCGRLGKTIKISGRIPKAEIRGCSDAANR